MGIFTASAPVSRIVNTCLVIDATNDWYTSATRGGKDAMRSANPRLMMRDGSRLRTAQGGR